MQLQNASLPGSGTVVALSPNATWSYPYLPGGPANVVRYEFAGCVPSDLKIAETCCSAVNGTFVEQNLKNVRTLNKTELEAIYKPRYPNQDIPAITTPETIFGNLSEATTGGTAGTIRWCTMAYSPRTQDSFQGGHLANLVDGHFSNVPISMNTWMRCFEDSVPAETIANKQAAYVCATDDLKTTVTIEGFSRNNTNAPQKDSGSIRNVASWWNIMRVLVILAALVQ